MARVHIVRTSMNSAPARGPLNMVLDHWYFWLVCGLWCLWISVLDYTALQPIYNCTTSRTFYDPWWIRPIYSPWCLWAIFGPWCISAHFRSVVRLSWFQPMVSFDPPTPICIWECRPMIPFSPFTTQSTFQRVCGPWCILAHSHYVALSARLHHLAWRWLRFPLIFLNKQSWLSLPLIFLNKPSARLSERLYGTVLQNFLQPKKGIANFGTAEISHWVPAKKSLRGAHIVNYIPAFI